ncbi:UDP-N-acetylmuramoyl-L-alanine--D-glutamate ligase [Sneathiella marina]|uniref:UDP-N-acetylmuramoylalanine--D-glutamate ligase n=1 Tax=Sneathiella marina TaxID=2950108 RepID=A0ABY4W0L9_9PROT|nr:UDP-N-acetylmuramoyl-L-alanine--D-glutamate ligase [Sneathiella marina]USG60404.1 UDP-N-acetylmuramoyl-L-alanine--D-glutamate ligase [Sneathiella marina]
MMESHAFENKNIAVFGLGKSGMATAERLTTGKAHVFVWDDNQGRRDLALSKGLVIKDLISDSWTATDALILSPGVPLTHPAPHPVVGMALKAGAKIVGDIEVFLKEKKAGKIIGVTGTNGKSTTSALIDHLLTSAGKSAALGGNIGTPVMDLPQLPEEGAYVLELSSYQLDLTPSWKADIAILLNITPDHLDRHGDMAGYAAVKCRIFQHQSETGIAIVDADDSICAAITSELKRHSKAKIVPISVNHPVEAGVYVIDGLLSDQSLDDQSWTLDISDIASLRGRHNWQNAAAAVAAASHLGLTPDEIENGLRTFGGLAHRMENVGSLDHVTFVNDSKATNAEAAEKALTSFNDIFWIAGGRQKAGGIEQLAPHFDRVREAFLIGEASESFANQLEGKVNYTICKDLEEATKAAALAAKKLSSGAIVLLSPAAASFDQFDSFEARGDAFRNFVTDLLVGDK